MNKIMLKTLIVGENTKAYLRIKLPTVKFPSPEVDCFSPRLRLDLKLDKANNQLYL